MADWLRTFAPAVPYASAMRFREVCAGIIDRYEAIVGKRIAKQFSMPALVLADHLPDDARKKQLELFEFVNGTAQSFWLDALRQSKRRGGDTTPKDGTVRARPGKADTAQAHYRALQELLFRGISPASVALLPHLPAVTDEPDKVASLTHLIEFTSTLKNAAQDALQIVKGRA